MLHDVPNAKRRGQNLCRAWLSGHAVGLCGAHEGFVEPGDTSSVRSAALSSLTNRNVARFPGALRLLAVVSGKVAAAVSWRGKSGCGSASDSGLWSRARVQLVLFRSRAGVS